MCLWQYNMTMTYPDRTPIQPTRFGYFGTMLSSIDMSRLGALILPVHQTPLFGAHRLQHQDIENLKYAVSTHVWARSYWPHASTRGIHKESSSARARRYISAVQHVVATYEAALIAVNETDFLEHERMRRNTGGAEGRASSNLKKDFGPLM
eukprot:gene11751-34477_t